MTLLVTITVLLYIGNYSSTSALTGDITAPSSAVTNKYAAYLKKVYLRSVLPVKVKWPPTPCKQFIELTLIERKEQLQATNFKRLESVDEFLLENSMSPVPVDELLQPVNGSPPRVVVIQGVPGIGKTVFAWTFCRKWAEGKIYQDYNLVILLHMRDTRVRKASRLSELFFSESAKVVEEITEDVISREGRGVLFILEGLDELPSSYLSDGRLLSNLLQGLSLPEVTILVTTRPWGVQMLAEKCEDQISRRVEILGYTKEDITKFASYSFDEQDKAEFLEYINSHPQLESIIHVPLNTTLMIQIYKQLKRSQQVIPQTLTHLYTALVEGLLLRHMKSLPEFSGLRSVNLENLAEPIKTQFQQICQLAFKSFSKDGVQVTFSDSEAATCGCLDTLGLMQSSVDLSISIGTTVTHSFLHSTIQEFLVAKYLSNQSQHFQEAFLKTNKYNHHFYMLITFFIGLNSDALQYVKESTDSKISTIQLHWLFESQSPTAISKYLGNDEVEYESLNATSQDLYALSYCLCHSNCKWSLTVDLSHVTSLYSTNNVLYNGEIKKLRITDANSVQLMQFFSLPKHLFEGIEISKFIHKQFFGL